MSSGESSDGSSDSLSEEEMLNPAASAIYGPQPLSYDGVLKKTVNLHRCGCCQQLFQNFSFFFVALGILCCNPIILGMSFLLVEPKEFKCMTNGTWHDCTKTNICVDLHGDKSLYFAVDTSRQHIENWVNRFDLLCMPRMMVGLIGCTYFMGVVVSTLALFPIRSYFRKKTVFCYSLCVTLLG
jgi:hypothetical protein